MRVESRFDGGKIDDIGGHTLLLKDWGNNREISVGSLYGKQGVAMGIAHGCELTVEAFPHVDGVKGDFLSREFYRCGDFR